MSTREEHPIDTHFRRVLAQTEVTPPPSVWAGVQQARQDRRRGVGLRWAWLLALLLVGAGIYMGLDTRPTTPMAFGGDTTPAEMPSGGSTNSSEDRAPVPSADHTRPPSAEAIWASATSPGKGITQEGVDAAQQTSGNNRRVGIPVHEEIPTPFHEGAAALAGVPNGTFEQGGSSPDMTGAYDNNGDRSPRDPGSGDQRSAMEPAMAMALALTGADAVWMSPLTSLPSHGLLMVPPLAVSLNADRYTAPRGEWWVGIHASSYDLRYRWQGSASRAVEGLNEAEAVTSTRGFGAMAGYLWNGRWGLAAGVQLERFERSFDHTERVIDVDQEIITYVVTLNAQVFVSDVDTLTTITVEEENVQGSVRRSITRIPLEIHWRAQHRRWGFGPALGLATEFTTHQEGYGFGVDPNEDRLIARRLEQGELLQRHPSALLASASFDINYMLTERWEIGARPCYMRGILAWGGTGPVYALPERWGINVQLTHHFIRQRSK